MTDSAPGEDGGEVSVGEIVQCADLRRKARLALERARSNAPVDGGKLPDPVAVAALDSALARLPKLERDVFLAMRVDHLTIEEIAARTWMSSEEARQIFVRAFGNLERNLANPRRCSWRLWLR